MYEQIREEFKPLFVKANLDFDIAYNNAYNQHGYKPDVVRNVLQAILDEYHNTTPTTKGGRIGRFLARIARIILPFIKIKK
jgi:hypothetical protein